MKIRVLSNYDLAKNLIHIINKSDELNKSATKNVSANLFKNADVSYQKAVESFDTFIKESEKAAQ